MTRLPSIPSGTLPPHGRILGITLCSGNQVRIRKIVMRSRARATGKYPSFKTGRMMQWESINELNAFRILDSMPEVETYAEQPCEICYLDDVGQEARHYPDIFVLVSGFNELWEIKTEADANSDPVRRRTALLTQELRFYGFTYRIVTAESLRVEPRLSNALKFLHFGRPPVSEVDRWLIEQMFSASGKLIWGEVCSGSCGPRGREIVSRLVLEGSLKIDPASAIYPGTEFRNN